MFWLWVWGLMAKHLYPSQHATFHLSLAGLVSRWLIFEVFWEAVFPKWNSTCMTYYLLSKSFLSEILCVWLTISYQKLLYSSNSLALGFFKIGLSPSNEERPPVDPQLPRSFHNLLGSSKMSLGVWGGARGRQHLSLLGSSNENGLASKPGLYPPSSL